MWSSIRKSSQPNASRLKLRWILLGLVALVCLLSTGLILIWYFMPTAPMKPKPPHTALSDLSADNEQRLSPDVLIHTELDSNTSPSISLTKVEIERKYYLLQEQEKMELNAARGGKSFQITAKNFKNPITLNQGKASFSTTPKGISIHTDSNVGVEVALATGSQLKLQAGSVVELTEPKGKTTVQLKLGEIELSTQKAGVQGVRVIFGQGDDFLLVRQAQVKLAMTKEGVRIKVVMGEITLHRVGQATNTLETGAELVVSLGEIKILSRNAQPRPLKQYEKTASSPAPEVQVALRQSTQQVPAQEGALTRVYVDRRRSWIGFNWKEKFSAETGILEVSRSPTFDNLVLRSPVSGNHYACRDLDLGKYYWRVIQGGKTDPHGTPGPISQLEVVMDPRAVQEGSREVYDTVEDTGTETKIFFQGEPPRLDFVWSEVPGAAYFLFRIFKENDMQNPILVEKVKAPRFRLAAGELGVGTYYWYQSALAKDDKLLHTSRLNKLTVAFHDVIRLLRIDSPRPDQRPVRGGVWFRGKAVQGSKLWVNKKSIRLTKKGHFKQRLSGLKPGQMLLFHLEKNDGEVVYFVRHLGK